VTFSGEGALLENLWYVASFLALFFRFLVVLFLVVWSCLV